MRVTIFGTGYVGLVTGTGLAGLGHHITFVDINAARVGALDRGEVPFFEPGLEQAVQVARAQARVRCQLPSPSALENAELSLICVGTPSDENGANDLRAVWEAARFVQEHAAPGHVCAIKSTVVPGTTARLSQELHMPVCMNPEFLREGSALADFTHPDRIVVGVHDDMQAAVFAKLYAGFDCPQLVVHPTTAEAIKYASNALLATLVSYANTWANYCEQVPHLNATEVMRAVHLDRRFRSHDGGVAELASYVLPGIGYGGSCLPKDVAALCHDARARGVVPTQWEATASVNAARPHAVAALLQRAWQRVRGDEPFAGQHVALLGLAFKGGTDDLRSSPALALAHALQQRGLHVMGYDPHVPVSEACPVAQAESLEHVLATAEMVVVTTADSAWSKLPWAKLTENRRAPLLVMDGRGSLADVQWPATCVYVVTGQELTSAQASAQRGAA